jgi:hypothetical protein
MIRFGICLLTATVLAGPALADSCKATADAKKLHGAALTSFMTKCDADAKAACDRQAAGKKLHGAAQTSFTTKCVKDAVGQ